MNRVKKRVLCFADERGNQNTDYTHADVGENRKPNRSITCRSEYENYHLNSDCKYKIEMNDVYCSLEKVVKTTCFLADMKDFARFNEIYGGYFTGKPARSCVAAKELPKGVLVEVEAIGEV